MINVCLSFKYFFDMSYVALTSFKIRTKINNKCKYKLDPILLKYPWYAQYSYPVKLLIYKMYFCRKFILSPNIQDVKESQKILNLNNINHEHLLF